MKNFNGIMNPILLNGKPSINAYYGPYTSIQEALTNIPADYRTVGVTVGIITNGTIKEYWWDSGIKDRHLVPKQDRAAIEADVRQLRNRIDANSSSIANLSASDETLRNQVSALQGVVRGVETKNADQDNLLSTIGQGQQSNYTQIEALKAEVNALKPKIPQRLEMYGTPRKDYTEGERVSKVGLTFKVFYKEGGNKEVTDKVVAPIPTLAGTGYFSYTENDITVQAEVTGLLIIPLPIIYYGIADTTTVADSVITGGSKTKSKSFTTMPITKKNSYIAVPTEYTLKTVEGMQGDFWYRDGEGVYQPAVAKQIGGRDYKIYYLNGAIPMNVPAKVVIT